MERTEQTMKTSDYEFKKILGIVRSNNKGYGYKFVSKRQVMLVTVKDVDTDNPQITYPILVKPTIETLTKAPYYPKITLRKSPRTGEVEEMVEVYSFLRPRALKQVRAFFTDYDLIQVEIKKALEKALEYARNHDVDE